MIVEDTQTRLGVCVVRWGVMKPSIFSISMWNLRWFNLLEYCFVFVLISDVDCTAAFTLDLFICF